MADKRVYTSVSGKAVKGLQRLVRGREVYVSMAPSDRGYTVVTTSTGMKPSKESAAKLSA